MGKVIIPDNEVWAWNGSILKPNPEHFEEGHTTGATGKKPRHDQFNYMEQRRDLNLQYLLRMAGLPYDPEEVYPVSGRVTKNGHVYVSLEDNNKGNDPISSGKWKHEDDDKFPPGTVIFNSKDDRNPSIYKGFGVWSLVEADTSISMVRSDAGSVDGKNSVIVPVPRHTHTTVAHNHTRGTQEISGEFNVRRTTGNGYLAIGQSGAFYGGGVDSSEKAQKVEATGDNDSTGLTNFRASRSWSGSSSSKSVVVNETGSSNAYVDVKGKRLKVYGWIRES